MILFYFKLLKIIIAPKKMHKSIQDMGLLRPDLHEQRIDKKKLLMATERKLQT